MEAAESISLTSKDYMWILTTSSVGLVTGFLDAAFPLGVLGKKCF